MPDPTRTIDHVVHAVDDLDAAAMAYAERGFTVTPRADHGFGTSNRLIVLDASYIEVVAVTDPEHLPISGFAARVASHLLAEGPGLTHVVLSSSNPEADMASLGEYATGDIFTFSRSAPQIDGTDMIAEFACPLVHAPSDLGMFLCHHLVPEAVWNEASTTHPNGVSIITGLDVPAGEASLGVLAEVARAGLSDGVLTLGPTRVSIGPAAIRFDRPIHVTEIAGVTVGG